eukprot:254013_1
MYTGNLAVPLVSDDLADFGDDQLEELLQCYEKEVRTSTFMKHRSSIISGSSMDATYLLKRSNKTEKKEHDELQDVKSKLETLQNVLKYLPSDVTDPNHSIDPETTCSGFLVIVGGNIADATRFYVELIGNSLYLRREPNSKIKQVISVSFIDSSALEEHEEEEKKHGKGKDKRIENGKYCDLFMAHLESRSQLNSFKIYSPTGIYVISASCRADQERFCKSIESELLSLFSNETWFAKIEASRQLLPMEREEFEIQMERHEQIMNSLTLTGLAHNMGLLGSTNKDKSGVMRILKHDGADRRNKHRKWEDHFFVLSHCTLYYFYHDPENKNSSTKSNHSSSSMPKSFISLKYATLELDIDRIKSDRFVFFIQTPLRTVYLRCRHPVALSEWVAALLKVMRHTKGNQNAHDILQQIRVIRSKVSTLSNLLKFKKGMQLFAEYLAETQCEVALRCWLAILHWKKSNNQQREDILDEFVNKENAECIWHCLPKDAYKDGASLDDISQILFHFLNGEFETHFVKRQDYKTLKRECDSQDKYLPMPLDREIDNFVANSILVLNISTAEQSGRREVKLSRKREVVSIGRDCSNDIVLDDSHVSRAHGRIQYDGNAAYFTDLGSHHGSYLNDTRVLYERLAPDDVIKIGQSVIQFTVKNKTNIINKVFSRILSSSNLNVNPSSSGGAKSKNSNQSKHRE